MTNYDKFMASNPTLIGSVAGVKYYEDSVYGDEAPLVAVYNGKCVITDHYELPSILESVWLAHTDELSANQTATV